MSAHVDEIDFRDRYEGEKAIRDKRRIMKLYDPDEKIKERESASYEETQWRRIVNTVKTRLEELKREMHDESFRPSLRTLWYDLVPDPFIANSQSKEMYTKVVEHLVEARHKKILPPDAFIDETRPDVDEVLDENPEWFAYRQINAITRAHEYYEPPRWHDQVYHVEVWCEKMAQASMIEHILEDKQLSIQINRGHPSYTIMYEAYERLKEIQERTGKMIIILYLGDWDPDGDIMDEEIVDYLDRFSKRYGKLRYEFERIAVLAEHETAFGFTLPSAPTKKMELKRNGKPDTDRYSNKARFVKRYGRLAQIELDALTSKQALPHFKKLLRDAVDKKVHVYKNLNETLTTDYWEQEIWDKFKDIYTEETAKQEIDRRIQLTEYGKKELEILNDIVGKAQQAGDKKKEQEGWKAYNELLDTYDNSDERVKQREEQKLQEQIKHHLEVEEPQELEKQRQKMRKMKDGPEKKKELLEQKARYELSIKKIEAEDLTIEWEGKDKKLQEMDRALHR